MYSPPFDGVGGEWYLSKDDAYKERDRRKDNERE